MGVNNLTYSKDGLTLTEQFEGFRALAYDDARPNYTLQPGEKIIGRLTIGYGHTGRDVFIGRTVTKAEAEALLLQDVARAVLAVNTYVDVELTQHEFDALVDFVFNLGAGTFKESEILALINQHYFTQAAALIDSYDHAGGVELAGLLRRRQAETALFNS